MLNSSGPYTKATDSQEVSNFDDQKPQFYDYDFLKEDQNGVKYRTSENFLKACSYKVDLKQLYHVKSTCYYHEDMVYCPVLLKIMPDIQKFYNDAKYILQVWTKKGNKVYEKHLQSEITIWNVFYKYFIYKTEEPDENSKFFHLVDLENQNSTYLIEDFVKDPSYKFVGYHDNTFYIANQKEVKLFTLVNDLAPGEIAEYSPSQEEIASIIPDQHRILGLFVNNEGFHEDYILMAIETLDNQVDFNCVHILKRPSSNGEFQYQLRQFREVVPRDIHFDPIEKFGCVFKKGDFNYAFAIRKSKRFDLYFNGQKVFSSEQVMDLSNPELGTAIDADLSFDTMYLRMNRSEVRSIEFSLMTRMSLENSNEDNRVDFMNIFYQRIKKNVKLFSGFCLIRTSIIVTHGHVLSQYNILKKMSNWTNHVQFEADIESVFRLANSESEFDIFVVLDGAIKLLKATVVTADTPASDNPMKQKVGTEIWTVDKDYHQQVPGQLLQFNQEREHNEWAVFLSKDEEGEPRLLALHQRKFSEVTNMIPKITCEHNFVFLFAGEGKAQFVSQHKSIIAAYDIVMSHESPIVNFLGELAPIPELLNRKIHSGIRFNGGLQTFLVDEENFYKVDIETMKTTIIEDQNCVGLYFSDHNFLYTLNHKSLHKSSGFKLYDMENVVEKGEDLSYQLVNAQVGCQGQIDYSLANQRIIFQSSFDTIQILPLCHRNTISFIGMQKRQMYLATKVIKDKFIALNNRNRIITRSILTGKLVMDCMTTQNNPGQDYSNFEVFKFKNSDTVYSKHWYNKILLKSKTPIKDVDENKFFDPSQTKTHIDNQLSFIKKIEKSFYEFKVIEIINGYEVKEHCSFVHPFYGGNMQYIYFSDNGEYMFERLKNQRLFLYQKQAHPEGGNKCSWLNVHRFTAFPTDLLEKTQHQLLFSPDLTMYVDLDRKHHTFVIRDSFTQNVKYYIPDTLMNSKHEDPINVINRFAWRDNKTLKLISHDGIERLVDITNRFKEIQFNVIQMYEGEKCRHFNMIIDQPSPEGKDSLTRLIKKYKAYKSTYYLDNKHDPELLYEKMFTVDYNVHECKDRYLADLSFTFLHWRLLEELQSGTQSIENIDNEQIQLLCYNILPGGETMLHKLSNNGQLLEKIFQVCHPNPEDRKEVLYHVPFLNDFKHQSPMKLLAAYKDFWSMNMMLEYLSGYGLDHHSRALIDEIPLMVEHDLPNIVQYFDSRLIQTEQCRKFKRGMIREKEAYGVVTASFWYGHEATAKLFQKAPIEQEIKLIFVDVPDLHSYQSEIGQEFFEVLADTERMELFDLKPIKKLIEFKWTITKEFTIKKLFIPFMIFQFLYLIFTNAVYYQRDGIKNEETNELEYVTLMRVINSIFEAILAGYGIYFCSTEFQQLLEDGIHYFKSIWNYMDLVPPVFIIVFIGMEVFGQFDNDQNRAVEGILQATISLFIWLKFLYFLRIFKQTGYLIKIIIEVVKEMRFFLLILLLTIVAFGDPLQQISGVNQKTEAFIFGGFFGGVNYVYEMILGNFSTENFGKVGVAYVWILFILCTIFNMIIMLNLLIAIISEAFAKVNSVSAQASYQEKASIIAENSYLIPDSRKADFCDKNKYLLLAIDVEQELKEGGDPVQKILLDMKVGFELRLHELEKRLTTKVEEIQKSSNGSLQAQIEEVKADNKRILELLEQMVPNNSINS